MGWVETKRWQDFRNPGSQGDGSFLGFTDGLKGQGNGYPGASPLRIDLRLFSRASAEAASNACSRKWAIATNLPSSAGGLFDPLGLAQGTDEQTRKYQEN